MIHSPTLPLNTTHERTHPPFTQRIPITTPLLKWLARLTYDLLLNRQIFKMASLREKQGKKGMEKWRELAVPTATNQSGPFTYYSSAFRLKKPANIPSNILTKMLKTLDLKMGQFGIVAQLNLDCITRFGLRYRDLLETCSWSRG
jgi:hypothetical protein